jgi:hypothetical protein
LGPIKSKILSKIEDCSAFDEGALTSPNFEELDATITGTGLATFPYCTPEGAPVNLSGLVIGFVIIGSPSLPTVEFFETGPPALPIEEFTGDAFFNSALSDPYSEKPSGKFIMEAFLSFMKKVNPLRANDIIMVNNRNITEANLRLDIPKSIFVYTDAIYKFCETI